MSKREILFEGLSENQILLLPADEIQNLILIGQPIVFRAGTASILGSFKIENSRLVVELAQIDGGGEGILIALSSLAHRFAETNLLQQVEWIVHAVSCAKPNLKLRRVLEKRGFELRDIPGIGTVYQLIERRRPGSVTH